MNISLHQTTMQISKMADIGRHSKSNPLHHPLPTPKTYATRSAQLIPLELRGSGLGEGPLTFTTVSDPLAHFPSREFIERRFRVRGVSIAGRRDPANIATTSLRHRYTGRSFESLVLSRYETTRASNPVHWIFSSN